MNKYKLTDDSIEFNSIKLYRIQALRSFGTVKEGDLGGYVQSEANLSHEDNCWVSGNAWVSDTAQVYGNARVGGDARVFGDAWVFDNAHVSDTAWVYGDAHVYGKARVYGDAQVYGKAHVYGDAQVSDTAWVYGNASVYGDAWVSDTAWVYGNAHVSGNTQVFGDARIIQGYIQKGVIGDRPTVESILAQTGLPLLPDGTIYGYKRVNKVDETTYTSCCDSSFKYELNKVVEVTDPDLDYKVACASGLHISHAMYWNKGDILLLVKTHIDDVIACQQGKLRVKKLEVIQEIG